MQRRIHASVAMLEQHVQDNCREEMLQRIGGNVICREVTPLHKMREAQPPR